MEREKKIAFIKIHDIWFDTDKFLHSEDPITVLHTNDMLPRERYDFRLDTRTFLLDISMETEEIFAKFEYKSAKYAINKAIRDEVQVRQITTQEEIAQYLMFQTEFCKEKGIPVLQAEELQELTCYYAVSADNEYLGACAFIESADSKTVRYKYGATKHKLNANEIILWQAIMDYHARGFVSFDFGGCIPTENKEDYYYRHYRFKKKFGGTLIDSYSYFRIQGIYRLFYYMFIGFTKLFFHGDVNGCTNFFNKMKILR